MSAICRIVLDTNVFVAAGFNPHSHVARLLAAVRGGAFILGTIRHSPTSGLNASRGLSLLVCAVIALLLLVTARRAIAREAGSSIA